MSKHTPGPWRRHAAFANGISDAEGLLIAASMKDEDANLIAAAPDLLAALIMVRDADDDCRADGLPTLPAPARAKIDAAIAKAEGGA